MKRASLALALLGAVVLWSCQGASSPTGPAMNEPAVRAADGRGPTNEVGTSAAGGTNRPLKGRLAGTLIFEFDWANPDCPVTTVTDAGGNMTHLGKVSSRWTHCAPVTQPLYTNGHVVFTAANGDQLEGEYTDESASALPWTIHVVGGTGRFADASGTIDLVDFDASGEWGPDGLPIQPWSWWGVLEGAISY
jgi:hypothetical protein